MENVGNIIFNQLKSLDLNSLYAWGASSFKSFKENQFLNEDNKNHLGGLIFKVNGLKHKKHVLITLNYKDYYDIQIGTLSNGSFIKRKNSQTLHDIDVDSLIESIDNLVEGYFENKKVYENVNLFK